MRNCRLSSLSKRKERKNSKRMMKRKRGVYKIFFSFLLKSGKTESGKNNFWRRERGGRTIFNLGWQNPNRQPLMFLGVITTSVAKQRARWRKEEEEEEEEVSLSSQVRGVEKRKGQSPPFSGGGQKIAASSS